MRWLNKLFEMVFIFCFLSVFSVKAQDLTIYSDGYICDHATEKAPDGSIAWSIELQYGSHVDEAKKRGISCRVGTIATETHFKEDLRIPKITGGWEDDVFVCTNAYQDGGWKLGKYAKPYVSEAKKRNLNCADVLQLEQAFTQAEAEARAIEVLKNKEQGELLNASAVQVLDAMMAKIVRAWRRPISSEGGLETILRMSLAPNGALVDVRVVGSSGDVLFDRSALTAVQRAAPFDEVKKFDAATFQEKFRTVAVKFRPEAGAATNSVADAQNTRGSSENKQSNLREKENARIRELEMELVALKAQKEAETRSINQDSLRPVLQIIGTYSKNATGFIEGRVTDNVGVVELLVDGQPIAFGSDGRFTYREYLPSGGKEFTLVAIDRAGLKTTETIRINREAPTRVAKISFDGLNPTTRQVKSNNNAVALIVGVAEYEKTAGAEFADKDAQVFYDYANLKLGIPRERIQTLVNDKADVVGLLSGINKWLKRSVRQGESDVYIFFAGHGLASDDGDTAYLIPYDGAPDFLERTAISRDEVFREVSSVNPRSVTVFLDTCYSGDTRGESRLIAGRPLGIKLQEQSLPKGFTVLTAAGGDQIARPLTEAQHGMFSYFLMKGMEGDADSDGNNEITARELHSYVRENVVQQSGGSQVPELQGDGEKVLVRFR